MDNTPRLIEHGIQDNSLLPAIVEPAEYGQVVPKFYIMAEKGPYGQVLVSGAQAKLLYGEATFDSTKKFYQHTTAFANKAFSAVACVIERVNVGAAKASAIHCIEIAKDNAIPVYNRDSKGRKIMTEEWGTVKGITIRHVVRFDGIETPEANALTGGTIYPIMVVDGGHGSAYNDYGLSVGPRDVTAAEVAELQAYPSTISLFKNINGTKTVQNTRFATKDVRVSFTNMFDAEIEKVVDVTEAFADSYGREISGTTVADVTIRTIQENIDTVLTKMAEAEFAGYADPAGTGTEAEPAIPGIFPATKKGEDDAVIATPYPISNWFDKVGGDKDSYVAAKAMFNMFSTKSASGAQYLRIVEAQAGDLPAGFVMVNPKSTAFLQNGTDGEVTLANLEAEVSKDLKDYIEPDSIKTELPKHPETLMIDSGFSKETKKDLCKFIGLRHDTVLILSTAIAGEKAELVDQISMAKILKAELEFYPDSLYFSTEVARSVMILGEAKILNSTDTTLYPKTLSPMLKVLNYMGAADGKWNEKKAFDSGIPSELSEMYDASPYVPKSVRPELQSIGCLWTEIKTDKTEHFLAFATVADSNSVLNNMFAIFCCSDIARKDDIIWKQFVGESRYTTAVFDKKVEEAMAELTNGCYDKRFTISHEVIPTASNGNKWYLKNTVKSGNMFTIMAASTSLERK